MTYFSWEIKVCCEFYTVSEKGQSGKKVSKVFLFYFRLIKVLLGFRCFYLIVFIPTMAYAKKTGLYSMSEPRRLNSPGKSNTVKTHYHFTPVWWERFFLFSFKKFSNVCKHFIVRSTTPVVFGTCDK
jgi:hypothetical protein